MTHGSLFSGIGGFDLAAEWMGWENKFHCEWNPFGQKILKYYWPNAESFSDITKTDFKKFYGTIDLLSGGFPCQPYSSAGKRKGKEDERHLWPHMLRAIKEIAPRYIVGENVRGLTNWNGGMVFEEVCAQMEDLGYQVAPFLIPASGVGAPHRRERIWFVAYAKSNVWNGGEHRERERIEIDQRNFCEYTAEGRDEIRPEFKRYSKNGDVANPNSNGQHQCNGNNEINPSERGFNAFGNIDKSNGDGNATDTDLTRLHKQHISTKSIKQKSCCRSFNERGDFTRFPTQSPICNGNDGISDQLDGITFSKWRNESIKAGGNAIVPQVAFQIFKAIEQHEILTAPAPDTRQSL